MPFIIDAGIASRAICDRLERDAPRSLFPVPMAYLTKAGPWTYLAELPPRTRTIKTDLEEEGVS